MKISQAGIDLIKHFEGFQAKAYLCPAGKLTVGYGHTGKDVKPGMVISQAQADALLLADLRQAEKDVNSLVTASLTQSQFDALVSFAFNVGSDIDLDTIAEGLGDSTLLRLVNRKDFDLASKEFLKWDKATNPKTGKKEALPGLTKRRRAESILFLGGNWRTVIK